MCRITRRTFRACSRTARRYSLGVTLTGWRATAGLGTGETDESLIRPGSMDTTRSVRDRWSEEIGTATTRRAEVLPWPRQLLRRGEPPPRSGNRLASTRPELPCWRRQPSRRYAARRPRPSPPRQRWRLPGPGEQRRCRAAPAIRSPSRSPPRSPPPKLRLIPARPQAAPTVIAAGEAPAQATPCRHRQKPARLQQVYDPRAKS